MQRSRLLDIGLISSSLSEFIVENIMKIFYTSRYQQKDIIGILSLFELLKFFLRCFKLQINQNRKIFISERSSLYCKELLETPVKFDDLFIFEYKEDPKENLKEDFPSTTKENKYLLFDTQKYFYNQGYEELFPRTMKIIKQISKMPIPEQMLHKSQNHEVENIKIWLGELIYIFRPIVYCYCLLFFRYSSYKPYFISMLLDAVRLILQRNIIFHWKAERNEFVKRNYDLVFNYFFRNPFYYKIIKGKILNPFLNKIFRKLMNVKRILIWILELRLSFSFLM